MSFAKTLLAAVAALALGSAQAQSISASDIKADYENAAFSASFSVLASSPWDATPDLGLKTQDGFTGVGVQGVTNGEIDWRPNWGSESITVDFADASVVSSLTLGVLFNGPEYSDVREVAKITVNGGDNYYLRATGTENVAAWYHGASFMANVAYIVGAGTQAGEGGAITLLNPFGDLLVDTIRFAADYGLVTQTCMGGSTCTNQSDYSIVNVTALAQRTVPADVPVTAVPEPETYALMLAGLGAVAFMARRRRERN